MSKAAIVVQRVMNGADEFVSHDGTSQYASGGVSACGLASLNFARILFATEEEGLQDGDLLAEMVSKRIVEDIVSICSQWPNNLHVEVEIIVQAPVFRTSLKLAACHFGIPGLQRFKELLNELGETSDNAKASAVAVLTRPPEIIACARTRGGTFLIFDSHTRPEHPRGAGLFLTRSLDKAAQRLHDLLYVDANLLTEFSFQWQAQLLSHFSAHVFVSARSSTDVAALTHTLMQSSLELLSLRSKITDLETQNRLLAENTERVEGDMEDLHDENRLLRMNLDKLATQVPAHDWAMDSAPWPPPPPSPGKGKARADADDESAEMAWKLQREFDADRAAVEEEHRVLSTSAPTYFDCCVCLETQEVDYATRIPGCEHTTCRDCLRQHVLTTLHDHRFPVLCPACVGDNQAKAEITQEVIFNIGIPEKEFAIYEELQLSAISTLLHCRGCQSSVFVDRAEYQESKIIVCPLPKCNRAWCKSCQQVITTNVAGPPHSCDGSSELDHLMSQRGWKYCPGCKTPIMKENGCNHMTCMSPGCNTHFCYVCGGSIIRSALRTDIRRAVSDHYRRCTLFEVPP